MKNKPWMRKDGSLKSTSELKDCSISWSPKTWERYLSETHNSRIRADFWSQDGLSQISQEEYQEAIAVRTPLSDYKELRNHLEHAMSFLSPLELKAIRAIYWENNSYSQTAQKLGVSKGTVQTHVKRAVAKLKKKMLGLHEVNQNRTSVAQLLEQVLKTGRMTSNNKLNQKLTANF